MRPRVQIDEARMLELAARGLDAEQVAAGLAIDTGVIVSPATIARRLREFRQARMAVESLGEPKETGR